MDTFSYVFLAPILKFIIGALTIYNWILIARALMSFFVSDYYSNPLVNFIYRITEPLLSLARRLLPFLRVGFFDFSIIAVFILLEILERILTVFLMRILPG